MPPTLGLKQRLSTLCRPAFNHWYCRCGWNWVNAFQNQTFFWFFEGLPHFLLGIRISCCWLLSFNGCWSKVKVFIRLSAFSAMRSPFGVLEKYIAVHPLQIVSSTLLCAGKPAEQTVTRCKHLIAQFLLPFTSEKCHDQTPPSGLAVLLWYCGPSFPGGTALTVLQLHRSHKSSLAEFKVNRSSLQ